MNKIALSCQLVALAVSAASCLAQVWPDGFSNTPIASGWTQPVGLMFAEFAHKPGEDTRLLVWDKEGTVWSVENGVKSEKPMIDIREEVGDWRDFGLLGFTVDPEFHHNGYVYLLYVVDYYHLTHYGLPDYDPSQNTYFHDTMGRIARFTCNPADGFRSVLPDSRVVLVGEDIHSGMAILHQSHGVGTLLFGEDGSLLASMGDGATYDDNDVGGFRTGSTNTGLIDGIITPAENVGAYRSQMINSLSGKVLRLNPENGDGLPDNPFYDPANPRAARSRVWALGLRNPFRMCLRPNSASASNPPGVLYVGDVGSGLWEELNVVTRPGMNFGWPMYEGFNEHPAFVTLPTPNQDAPNPLYDPAHPEDCPRYFTFHNLFAEDSLLEPSFPNPCDKSQQMPASIPTFMHSRPMMDWRHYYDIMRVPIFVGNYASACALGQPGCLAGTQLRGNTSVAGVWYTGTSFPHIYHNTYFHSDWTGQWVINMVIDQENHLQAVRNFAPPPNGKRIVAMVMDPANGDICYALLDPFGPSSVGRVTYTGNSPPVIHATASPNFGLTPLTVEFNSDGTSDPDDIKWTFLWDFGDGTPMSTENNPAHVFDTTEDITATGTIIARVLELKPSGPQGTGNSDPEVIRDGDYPPVGSARLRQFDTFHGGDQGTSDWIGYTFPSPRELNRLVFQEGINAPDGGWFDSFNVQVRVADNWISVTDLVVSPAYPNADNGVSFEKYHISFAPVVADGIRIEGLPGGSNRYISVSELRAFAGHPSSGPIRRLVHLTATDSRGAPSEADVLVSLNNTPPVVQITSPVEGRINICGNITVQLNSIVSDAEYPNNELTCVWQTILHHNEHGHPEPPDYNCQTSAVLTPHGTPTDTFSWEFRLTVTDPTGLSTSQVVMLIPDCCRADWNTDGVVNSQDFFNFLAGFFLNNGDFNFDGVTDSQDFFDFLSQFFIGCEE